MFSFLSADQDVHDFVAVDAHRLAEQSHLVREADFRRMPGVVCILDRLGAAN